MNKRSRYGNHAAVAVVISTFVLAHAGATDLPASVDAARLNRADRDAANWLSYGRTYSEQRFSPLTKITAENAKELGLAWYADLDTNRGQQATPLVVDGVMYVSTGSTSAPSTAGWLRSTRAPASRCGAWSPATRAGH